MADPTKPSMKKPHIDTPKTQLDAIQDRLDNFIETYETDMRGDKDLTNGNRGVIGEIRAIKECLDKYPSIALAFSRQPVKTMAIVLVSFLVLDTLSTFGVLHWILSFFTITVPTLITNTPTPFPPIR